MSGTLPFGTDPYAPPVSPFATPANAAEGLVSPLTPSRTRSLLDMLTAFANGNAAANNQMARGFQQAGDQGAGFTGTGLRGPGIADVTRDYMNLGPQAGLMKSVEDIQGPLGTMANIASRTATMGLPGMALGIAQSPVGRGLAANVMNYSDIADKTAAMDARGGMAAPGGPKGGMAATEAPAKPDALSPAEVAAQMANAMTTNDMAGDKGGFGPGGPDSSSGNSNSSNAGGSTNTGPDSNGMARGGLIELVGGGKVARGPGGGMDDLIPTTIEGQRAAALSDGEFVMPADVVAMMGDGSTNAGSQRLYDLVRQIREAKTGTGKQAEPLQFTDILRRTLG